MHACTSQMISIISTATVSRAILQAPFAMTARQPTTTNNVLSGSSQPPALIRSQSPSFLFSSPFICTPIKNLRRQFVSYFSYYIYFEPLSSPLLLASIWPYRRGGGRASYSLVLYRRVIEICCKTKTRKHNHHHHHHRQVSAAAGAQLVVVVAVSC